MKFPYVRFSNYYVPVIPVVLIHGSIRYDYQVLVDTGANISIIHADVATLMGVDLNSGFKQEFGGIAGGGSGHIHSIDIEIGGTAFVQVPVLFTSSITRFGFGIIGHKGLFDKLRLVFEYGKKEIELVPKTYES